MLRIIGCCLIIGAGTWIGFYFAYRLKERTKQLNDLQKSLQILETEIYYGSTPLEHAFKKIAKQIGGTVSGIFHTCTELFQRLDGATTAECWQEACSVWKKRLALKEQEMEWLAHFGHVIGSSDREDQKKHLQLLLTQVKHFEREAREEQLRNEKMYKTLGFLAGAVVVILLI